MKSLVEKYNKLKNENPKARIRDIANQLGVKEVELIAISNNNIQLKDEFEAILNEIPQLGPVMALTRNEFAVHERKGTYNTSEFHGKMGQVVGPDIDLRLFLFSWKFAFAVIENDKKSIQFFAKDGSAIHKIYLTKSSNEIAFDDLVEKYRDNNFSKNLIIEAAPQEQSPVSMEKIDIQAFQQDWLALENTHQFFSMLKKHGVDRRHALQHAPEGYSQTISKDKFKEILQKVAKEQIEIMVFIGNKGCIQIHSGAINRLVQADTWYNILDQKFNMHLNEDGIADIWVVKKPSTNGIISSIEILDTAGEIIVQFFGKRNAGVPEPEGWKKVLTEIDNSIS